MKLLAAWHASDFVPTLKLKPWPGPPPLTPTCDLRNINDIQDEQHILFYCTHPLVLCHAERLLCTK